MKKLDCRFSKFCPKIEHNYLGTKIYKYISQIDVYEIQSRFC